MIKERPILFSAPMVRAILDGRKTQTRRVAKLDPRMMEDEATDWCPYGKPGERLWVKETFAPLPGAPYEAGNGVIYRATEDGKWTWKPSIFMPRWASRITLEIVSVRAERLQEITESDAKAEGVEPCQKSIRFDNQKLDSLYESARWRGGFEVLWDSINAKTHPWTSNPWVWVLTFKQIK